VVHSAHDLAVAGMWADDASRNRPAADHEQQRAVDIAAALSDVKRMRVQAAAGVRRGSLTARRD
jgi:hypothetical protein